jgi:putative Mn2+ efflux pump MntP
MVSDATKKVATGAITLAVLGSAAWAGFTVGGRSKKTLPRVAGYVGGIGAALLGVAVLGNAISMPQVTEFTTKPFNLQVA